MTPLVAVIVIVLIGVLAANVVGRARAGARSVRSHHRALDTLGQITTQRPVPGATVRGLPDAPRQAHIRILTPTVEEPPPATVEAEVEAEAEVQVPAPVAARFVLTPAPPNDLWDTVAIRELVDGPEEPELVVDDDEMDDDTVDHDAACEDEVHDAGDPSHDDLDLTDGGHANGNQVNGNQVNGNQVNGNRANGNRANGDRANGKHSNGQHSNGVHIDAGQTNGRENGDRTGEPTGGERAGANVVRVGDADALAIGDETVNARWAGFEPETVEPVTLEIAATHRSRLGAHAAEAPRRRRQAALAAGPQRSARGHRRSQRTVAAVVVVALAAIAVIVVLGRHHGKPAAAPPLPHSATTTPTSHPASARTKKKAHTATKPVKLVSDVPGVATYRLASGARVTLKADGPCWVEIRKTNAEGPDVYTATMMAGATESVTAPAWVRLGRPTAVAVTVGGTVVSPPSTPGRPYDLLFE